MRTIRGGKRKRGIGRRDRRVDILLVDRTGVILGLLGSGAENETGKGKRCSTAGGVLHVVIVPRSVPSASEEVIVVAVDDVTACEVITVDVAGDCDGCDTGTDAGVKTNSGSSFCNLRRIARSASVFMLVPRNVFSSAIGGFSRLMRRRATSV